MKIYDLNQAAWDRAASEGTNPYACGVSSEQVAEARRGQWTLYLSDCRPVPRGWFPELRGRQVLCLASGGGQQAPILAAAGAVVTLLDASPGQLAQDQKVAEREHLEMRLVKGDMADLSAFTDASFELIVNPPSTLFVPELEPVWRECYRVLRPGGALITGFMNPDEFIFDADALDEKGAFVVRYGLPYVEYETLSAEARAERIRRREMFHFSHTMEAQLGGLTKAGFAITGFYEDRRPEEDGNPICRYMTSYYVARARKVVF